MTITLTQMALYVAALVVLVITPGPVVVATIARTLASGMRSALPLITGVSLVHMLWPLLAILGLSALVQANADALQVLRYVGGAILVWMGWRLIQRARGGLSAAPDPALMRRTAWQGFAAGVLINLGNPKSIFFFVGILPNVFDMTALTGLDVAVILALSGLVPFLGDLCWSLAAHRARRFLSSSTAVRRMNQVSGGALMGTGVAITAV